MRRTVCLSDSDSNVLLQNVKTTNLHWSAHSLNKSQSSFASNMNILLVYIVQTGQTQTYKCCE